MKDFHFVVVLFLIVLTVLVCKQNLIWAEVVSQPSIQYVYKNDSTMVNCLNTTENGTLINFIDRSVWYRVYSNGSILITARYDDSSTIFVHMYALVFTAVEESDQGQYKCCAMADERSCSVPTTVSIAEDPIMKVETTDYTAFVGSNTTLACKIIYVGKPPAKFRWRRNGNFVPDDLVYNNSTYTILILINLVEEDSGLYRCVSDAVLSFRTYTVYLHLQVVPKLMIYGPNLVTTGTVVHINCTQLEGTSADLYITTPQGTVNPDSEIIFNATVNDTGRFTCTANTSLITITEKHYLFVYDVDNTTSYLNFLVILPNGDCDTVKELIYARNISVALEKYIYDQVCKCNVSVTPVVFTCNGNTNAVYTAQITGYSARNVQQYLYNYHLTTELNLEFATLYACNQFCQRTNGAIAKAENVTTSSYRSDDHTVAISLASSSLALLVTTMLVVLVYSASKRIRKHHICVARQETSMPQRHSQELIAGVTNPVSVDDELNNIPINSEQTTTIAYTDNPTYESVSISCPYKECTSAGQCVAPVEVKRNEEYPRSNVTRNVDALNAYLDGSTQSYTYSAVDVGNNVTTEQDTEKYVEMAANVPKCRNTGNTYDDTLSPSFEASAVGHPFPAQTAKTSARSFHQYNNQIVIAKQEAPQNTPRHIINPTHTSHKTCNANPCQTDV